MVNDNDDANENVTEIKRFFVYEDESGEVRNIPEENKVWCYYSEVAPIIDERDVALKVNNINRRLKMEARAERDELKERADKAEEQLRLANIDWSNSEADNNRLRYLLVKIRKAINGDGSFFTHEIDAALAEVKE
jgi:hypothetical protein